ncbi:hypothetical protein [Saccharibacillus deserti]|uniref:hypothetical protein n=1 Tax=Saccharibacillus deserti TaxID=1634444 RepID=UPI001555BD77|nr:hypothetical protein [Saccharibacillus deserti]
MPWPMVHFAVSQQLYSGNPTPHLLLGSIAPDAVHSRGNVTREEKGSTHLVREGRLPEKERIFEKFEEYLLLEPEPEWSDFVVGYFTHIYTDLRWTETLYSDFEKAYTGDRIRDVYHGEASQLEFELQRSLNQASEIKRRLAQAEGYAIRPFVTAEEVRQYRDLKLQWLDNPNNEPHISNRYFTAAQVEIFITETTHEIKEILKNRKGSDTHES